MTIAERVRSIVDSQVDLTDEVPAGIEKMIYMAYYMGREDAAAIKEQLADLAKT